MSTSFAAVVFCVLLATSAALSSQGGDAESCVMEEGPRAGSKMLQKTAEKGERGEDSRHSHHHGHHSRTVHAQQADDAIDSDDHAHGRAKLKMAPLKVKVTVLETDMAGLKTNIATLETMVGLEAEGVGAGEAAAAGAAAEAVAPAAEAVAPAALLEAPEAALLAADGVEALDGSLKVRITKLESFFSDARSRVMSLNNEVLGAMNVMTLLATGNKLAKASTRDNLRHRVDSMEDWADHLKGMVTTLQREVIGTQAQAAAATPA